MKLEFISIRRSGTLTEKWVQDQIEEDPSILGLGDLDFKDRERRQANAGRLDLLLQDPETLKRYEVEIQLGSTDESHIIRTIEYWEIEKKRYPQYEHVAVIVAEEITARFLNVIQLFNGAIPLIALKMTAYKCGDEPALTFVKVLDEVVYGLVDEDEPVAEPADRAYWEKKAAKKTVGWTEGLLDLVNEVEPKATLRYNKHYIGLGVEGQPLNFVTFKPKKAHVIMQVKLAKTIDIDEQLEEVGLETLTYDTRANLYRLRIEAPVDGKARELLAALVARAREDFGRAT